MKKLIVLLIFLFNVSLNAQQAGDLDFSFATNGKGTTNIKSDNLKVSISSQAIQSDGKIVLVGTVNYNGLPSKGYITRLNIDGTTDLTFLGSGVFISDTDSGFTAVKIGADNKIFVGGNNTLSKLNSNGTFDLSFDNDGFITQTLVVGLELQTDGKILVLSRGTDSVTFYPNCKLKRYSQNGILDNSFATNGTLTFGTAQSYPISILLQPDQKILVGYNFSQSPGVWGGHKFFRIDNDGSNANTISYNASSPASSRLSDFAIQPDNKILMVNSQGIYRYNTDLSLDLTFGINGFLANISSTTDLNVFSKLEVQTDGKIVVMGINYQNYFTTYAGSNVFVSRYNTNGSIDNSFNQNGLFLIPSTEISNIGKELVVFNNNVYVIDTSSTLSKINSSGNLDLTFGNVGQKLISTIGESDDNSIMSVIQSDGKLLTLGNYLEGSNRLTSIVRYNVDGTIDTSFALNGKFTHNSIPNSIGLQNNGKILFIYKNVSGSSYYPKIMRLDTNGNVDISFGVNGIQEIVIPEFISSSSFNIKKTKILSDNKILILGYYDSTIYGTTNIYRPHILIKLNADGSFDNSFNSSGYNISDIYPDSSNYGFEYLNDIIILNDGKMLVGGSFYYYNRRRVLITKFNSDGSIDNSFAINGISVLYNYPTANVPDYKYEVNAMDLQNDGKLIINIKITEYSSIIENNFLIARINTDGTLDSSFGQNGIVDALIENSCNSNSLKILPSQQILVSGYSIGSNKNFALVKYNSDGTLDSTFGNQGKVITSFNNKTTTSNCLVLTNDNKVILTGTTKNTLIGNNDFAFAKYYLESSLSTTLHENNKTLFFYPNPALDFINLNKEFKSFSVFSIDGKLMFFNNDVIKVNVSSLPKGTYIINAIDENDFTFSEKLIKL